MEINKLFLVLNSVSFFPSHKFTPALSRVSVSRATSVNLFSSWHCLLFSSQQYLPNTLAGRMMMTELLLQLLLLLVLLLQFCACSVGCQELCQHLGQRQTTTTTTTCNTDTEIAFGKMLHIINKCKRK